jgi:hypothetical protein
MTSAELSRTRLSPCLRPGDPRWANRWDETMAVYGGQVLAAIAFENDGPPPSRRAAIARRALRGTTRRLLQAAMADPQVRQRIVDGRDRTLSPEGGEGPCV